MRQIYILDDEYDTITNQQKLSQADRERLIERDKQTEIWTNQDTHENKQRLVHKADNHQQQQQQQYLQKHVMLTGGDRTHHRDNDE